MTLAHRAHRCPSVKRLICNNSAGRPVTYVTDRQGDLLHMQLSIGSRCVATCNGRPGDLLHSMRRALPSDQMHAVMPRATCSALLCGRSDACEVVSGALRHAMMSLATRDPQSQTALIRSVLLGRTMPPSARHGSASVR
eukprot:8301167-Pyramimonas_sp.AAC.1